MAPSEQGRRPPRVRGSKRPCPDAPLRRHRLHSGPVVETLESRLLLAVNLLNPSVPQLPVFLVPKPAAYTYELPQGVTTNAFPLAVTNGRIAEAVPLLIPNPSSPAPQPVLANQAPPSPPVSQTETPPLLPPSSPPMTLNPAPQPVLANQDPPSPPVSQIEIPPLSPPTTSPTIWLAYANDPRDAGARPPGTFVSSPVVTVPSPVDPGGPPQGDSPPQNPEDAELTLEGIQKLPALPNTDDVAVSGNLGPEQTWATYKMSLGSSTESLKVTVSNDQLPPAPGNPALDQLYLVGPQGNLLAELKGASANFVGPRQDVDISLSGIPQGSQLVLRVVENPAIAPQTSLPQPAPTGTLAFTMEVQRTDLLGSPIFSSPVSAAGSSLSSTYPLLFGVATGSLAAVPTSLALSSSSEDLYSPVSDPSTESPNQAAPPQAVEDYETAAIGVSVGPLVIRGAAAVGPMLATTPGDSTQTIDRTECAFDLALAGSGTDAWVDAELLDVLATSKARFTSHGTSMRLPSDLDQASESLVALRGPGGLPLMVTALPGDRSRVDSSELLATLPTLDDAADREACVGALSDAASIKLRRANPGPDGEDLPCTDFLTAACGLAIGVGLTTGPLYPDLMVLVRTWLPSKLRRGSLALAAWSGRKRPHRLLARWFGRRPR